MIEAEGLTKRYANVAVVDDVSITVQDGELLVLLGGSGSGKTTTLKMINRLIEPSTGSIRIDGQDVSDIEPHELRRRIGYVFQQIGLFPHLTVSANVGITLSLLGWNQERVDNRVDELLDLVELSPSEVRGRLPSELSGGQQQRVGVARALAASPRLMLLDEPFGALDPLTRDRLQQSFLRIRKQLGLTAIFVSHDMVEAMLLGDRIAVMKDGKIIQIGVPQELLLRPANDHVRELMETPMRQARVVDDILGSRA